MSTVCYFLFYIFAATIHLQPENASCDGASVPHPLTFLPVLLLLFNLRNCEGQDFTCMQGRNIYTDLIGKP